MEPANEPSAVLDPALRRELEQAAEGLVYSSEGDHPFEVFALPWGDAGPVTPEAFAARVAAAPVEPVGEVSLDRFLAHHLETSDPYDTEAQRIRPRYERLKALLLERLDGVRVFRVGEVQVRCYVVGRDGRGNLAGYRTLAVET
ncbi:MAG TPA: nuclease A inhibitor family protein [Longimicrobiaceae bacterium]|nr:nuclease A inhibitor family protein [Longimicrobiaceae bacterium]